MSNVIRHLFHHHMELGNINLLLVDSTCTLCIPTQVSFAHLPSPWSFLKQITSCPIIWVTKQFRLSVLDFLNVIVNSIESSKLIGVTLVVLNLLDHVRFDPVPVPSAAVGRSIKC